MPFNLKDFPKQLPVTPKGKSPQKRGTKHQRDEKRLLVALKTRMTRQEIEPLLGSCGLKLEDAGEREIQEEIIEFVEDSCRGLKDNPEKIKSLSEEVRTMVKDRAAANRCIAVPDLSRKVAHAASRFWIRADSPIVQTQVDQLIKKVENKVRWIGPVYQSPSAQGRKGFFCPLPNVLIVQPAKLANDVALAKTFKSLGLQEVRRRSKYMGSYRYVALKDQDLEKNINTFKLLPVLKRARKLIQNAWLENLPLLSAASATPLPQPYQPDDQFYVSGDQWNLTQIMAEQGWGFLNDLQRSGATLHPVTICILDSDGVDLGHEEFKGQVVNAYTVPGAETDPANPLPPGQADQQEPHGTCCAGIATATTNNRKGIAGLAGLVDLNGNPIFSLMPVRAGESLLGWASGIRYAADAGADVISISMNPALGQDTAGNEMAQLDEAIDYAVNQKGVVICVSSGNSNSSDGTGTPTNSVEYPATHPAVIACGAINQQNQRCQPGDWSAIPSGGSSYGDDLSVVAPGVLIPTTTTMTRGRTHPGYTLAFSGTSAAAPHVAGLAALLLSANPNLRPAEVQAIIEKSAQPLPGYSSDRNGWNSETGYGLINVWRALQLV